MVSRLNVTATLAEYQYLYFVFVRVWHCVPLHTVWEGFFVDFPMPHKKGYPLLYFIDLVDENNMYSLLLYYRRMYRCSGKSKYYFYFNIFKINQIIKQIILKCYRICTQTSVRSVRPWSRWWTSSRRKPRVTRKWRASLTWRISWKPIHCSR